MDMILIVIITLFYYSYNHFKFTGDNNIISLL